jgi:hypothetical protein
MMSGNGANCLLRTLIEVLAPFRRIIPLSPLDSPAAVR